MDVLRYLAPRWIAAGLGLLSLGLVVPAARVTAATSSLDVGDQPVVIVRAQGAATEIDIRTWDRPNVQVDADATPGIEQRTIGLGNAQLNRPIPPAFINPRDPSSPSLPPEEFPLANIRPGTHQVVMITAEPGTHITVTVPATTGILETRAGPQSRTTIDGYHGADLFAFQVGGLLRLQNVTTTALLQMNNGMLSVSDSSFDRVRVRTNNAHTLFERVRSKQIEASSIHGAIVYDGGTFEPGLARFDSVTGNIALGVSGAAQVSARSQDGHVYTSFDRRDAVVSGGGNAATATVGGGGTVVSAVSGHGNVLLYDGSLRSRKQVPAEFRQLHQALTRPRAPQSFGRGEGRMRR